jgi:hypothetical protein
MGFDLCDYSLKVQDSNSQSERSLGNVKVHSLKLSYTPRSMKCDSRVSLLAFTLARPCLGREGKARVATAHFIPTKESAMAQETGRLFFLHVFKHHGLPKDIVLDQDPKFTSKFWQAYGSAWGRSSK